MVVESGELAGAAAIRQRVVVLALWEDGEMCTFVFPAEGEAVAKVRQRFADKLAGSRDDDMDEILRDADVYYTIDPHDIDN